MAIGDDWMVFEDVYGGGVAEAVDNSSWYDGALESVTDLGGAIYDGASNWLGQLMNFELQKEQLSFQNQLANQQAVLGAVESDQQTGNVPASPNYRQISSGFVSDNKNLLLVLGVGLAAYLLLK